MPEALGEPVFTPCQPTRKPYSCALACKRCTIARRSAAGRSTCTCGDKRMSCSQACSTDSMGIVTATRPSLRRGGDAVGSAATAAGHRAAEQPQPLKPLGRGQQRGLARVQA